MHQVMSMIRDSFYKKRKRLFFTIDRYNRLNKPDWMTEYNIKGKKGYEEDVQVFADHLSNEVETLFNYKIPKKLTKGKPDKYISVE